MSRGSEHVCRLCLAESADGADMMPLFPVRGGNPFGHGTVVSKILQCTSVKIEHFEGAPAMICEYCLARIDDWQAFREQCVGTDEYLRATCRPTEDGPYVGGQEVEYMEEQAEMVPKAAEGGQEQEEQGDENGSYLVGEELPVEELMLQQQMDEYYGQNGYDDEDEEAGDAQQEPDSLVQQMNLKSGIRVPKWSQEFGAKLNSLLLVVGGERPHQCKICRKVFMRRPHCRRHVAQAHPQEVEDVQLPNNWKQTFKRRTNLSKVPIQAILQPVPPPPVMRAEQYDPSIDRPHQCEVCKKCFKRAQHLRRHRTSHLQIEIDRSEIMRGIQEQQKAQQQLEQLIHPTGGSSQTKEVEDDDVIALSDDDEDMGEEISPEEYNGFSGRHFLDQLNGDPQEEYSYGQENDDTDLVGTGSEESNQSQSNPFLTKNGTFRKRAAPMEKIPGERPYQCKLCAKTFKRSDHLKSHMKVHSSECEYNCPHCAKGFRYRQNYLIHLKNRTCFERGARKARKSMPATLHHQAKPNKQRVLNKLSASLSQSLIEGKRKREVLGE